VNRRKPRYSHTWALGVGYAVHVNDRVNHQDAEHVAAVFEQAADAIKSSPYRRGSAVRLPRRGRLLVTGDLHDNPDHFRKIVHLSKLDESPDNHVVLHEIIHGEHLLNGMDFSYRMLANVAELVCRFPNQVHPLLANHELSQLTGRGVSKGAGNSVDLFNDAIDFVFGDEAQAVVEATRIFFRAMPLALITESGVCVAHSLPNQAAMKSFDLKIVDRELSDADYVSPTGSAYLMVWGRVYDERTVHQIGEAWGSEFFLLGHKHVDTGIEQVLPRVIVLNSDHERAVAIPLNLSELPAPEDLLLRAVPLQAVGLPE
jgi:hypothetical protein